RAALPLEIDDGRLVLEERADAARVQWVLLEGSEESEECGAGARQPLWQWRGLAVVDRGEVEGGGRETAALPDPCAREGVARAAARVLPTVDRPGERHATARGVRRDRAPVVH